MMKALGAMAVTIATLVRLSWTDITAAMVAAARVACRR